MNHKTKELLLQIFATKIGWLCISLLSVFVFGILSGYFEWAIIWVYISWIYPIIFGLIMFVYGWIINPIRDYKERKKNAKK